jgi:hydrogenase maturation protease
MVKGNKTIIIGLGNSLLSDDGVGIEAVRRIKKQLKNVATVEGSIAEFEIVELMEGYDKAIIIDGVKTNERKVGEFWELELEEIKKYKKWFHRSSHGMDLWTAVELGRKLGYKLPKEIKIYVMEVKDNTTFKEELTKEMKIFLPKFINYLLSQILK